MFYNEHRQLLTDQAKAKYIADIHGINHDSAPGQVPWGASSPVHEDNMGNTTHTVTTEPGGSRTNSQTAWLADVIIYELRNLASQMGKLGSERYSNLPEVTQHLPAVSPTYTCQAAPHLFAAEALSILNRCPSCQGETGNGHRVYKSNLRLPAYTDVNASDHFKMVSFWAIPTHIPQNPELYTECVSVLSGV